MKFYDKKSSKNNNLKKGIEQMMVQIEKYRKDILIDTIDLSLYSVNQFEKLDAIINDSARSTNEYFLFKKNTGNRIK